MAVKKTISSKYIGENPYAKVREDEVEFDNGKIEKWHVIERNPGSMIFAITEKNEILLIKNHAYAWKKDFIELPAGFMDKNEAPEEAAKRELLEETGYSTGSLEKIGELYVSPTHTKKITHVFLARKCKKFSSQELDASEKVAVFKVKLNKLIKMLENNEITSADSVASILLALNKLKKIKI